MRPKKEPPLTNATQSNAKLAALAQRHGRVHRNVERRVVEGDVVEQQREREEEKARIAEGARVRQGAPPGPAGRLRWENDGERHGGEDKVDGRDGSDRPSETDVGD